MIDYATEGRINQACADAGIIETALPDVIARYRDHQFTEAELANKIAEWRESKPHYFVVQGGDEITGAVAAFGPARTLKAQAEFVKKHGEARAREVAARYGTALGGKPGKIPEAEREQIEKENGADKSKTRNNPWLASQWNLKAQGDLVKRIGIEAASRIAAAAGCRVGSTRPNPAFN